MENLEHLQKLQGEAAQVRRDKLTEKYQVTEEEISSFKEKIKNVVDELGENSDIETLVQTLDTKLFNNDIRNLELKNLFIDSLLGKLSESIKFFLPPEAQGNLKDILNPIAKQLKGQERSFNSVDDIYTILKKNEAVFEKLNLDFNKISQKFINELNEYISSLDLSTQELPNKNI